VKVLWFEGHGLCILYKRLHRAVFEVPVGTDGSAFLRIDASALGHLLTGVAPRRPATKKRTMSLTQMLDRLIRGDHLSKA